MTYIHSYNLTKLGYWILHKVQLVSGYYQIKNIRNQYDDGVIHVRASPLPFGSGVRLSVYACQHPV